jgi:hypothetical protein
MFLDLFISTNAVHVSDGSSVHHQEHTTVHTASGIVNSNDRVEWIASKFVHKLKLNRLLVNLCTDLLAIHSTPLNRLFVNLYTDLLAIHVLLVMSGRMA